MTELVLSCRHYLGGLFYHLSGANKTNARKCLLGSSGWTVSSLDGGGARDASALAEELLAVDEGWWERSQCSSEVRLLGRSPLVQRLAPHPGAYGQL